MSSFQLEFRDEENNIHSLNQIITLTSPSLLFSDGYLRITSSCS